MNAVRLHASAENLTKDFLSPCKYLMTEEDLFVFLVMIRDYICCSSNLSIHYHFNR